MENPIESAVLNSDGPPGKPPTDSPFRRFLESDLSLVLAAALVAIGCLLFGGKLPYNDGFGADGVIYREWARNFHEEIFVKRVNVYSIQRVLPAAIVHYALRLLHLPRTNRVIFKAFAIYTAMLYVIVAVCWCRVVRELRIRTAGKWLGFIALFLSLPALKYLMWAPVHTDASGWALAMLMLVCYLRRATGWLVAVTLIGAFSWPTCIHIGALMLIFPRPACDGLSLQSAPRRLRWLAVTAVVALTAVAYLMVLQKPPTYESTAMDPLVLTPYEPTLYLSLILCLAYVLAGCWHLLNSRPFFELTFLMNRQRLATIALVAAGLVVLRWLQNGLSNGSESHHTMDMFVRHTVYTSLVRPGVFFVALAAFFGPIVLVAAILWKSTCRYIHAAGPAIGLSLLMGLFISLDSQSRYLMNHFPLLIPFVVKAMDEWEWDLTGIGLFAAVTLLSSKFWIFGFIRSLESDPFAFPGQLVWMAFGPWMSSVSYAVQAGLVVLLTAVFVWRLGPRRSAPMAAMPEKLGDNALLVGDSQVRPQAAISEKLADGAHAH